MAKNQEKTKNDIYNYLKSNGYEPVYKSTNGKEVSVPEEAEVIQFQFKLDGRNYGTAGISLDNEGKLKIYYSDKIENSPTTSDHGEITWNQLIPNIRQMIFGKVKSFELDDMDNLEYDMAKREHSKKLEEGYHPMGKKASYNDNIPECKIIIKHNRNIEEGEQRYRNIHQIFIENQLGERFLAPTQKPGLARVYARHIAEGGKVNDDKWNHINTLVEEYTKMAGFVRATRNGQFNEDTQRLVSAGVEHYLSLRESLHKLAGKRGYNQYFESYTPTLMEGEEDEGLSEMFINSSLDPRIESVIPILNRLNKNISENQEIKQVVELEEWADKVIEGEDVIEGLGYSTDPDQAKWYHEGRKAHKHGTISNNGLIKDIARKHGCPPEWLDAFSAGYQDQEGWSKDEVTEGNPVPGQDFTDRDGQKMKWNSGTKSWQSTGPVKPNDGFDVMSVYQNQQQNQTDNKYGSTFTSTGIAKNPTTGQQKSLAKWDYTDPNTGKNYSGSTYTDPDGNATTEKNYNEDKVKEDIGPQQQAVGQLGATAKVNAGGTILGNKERSQKGLRGKLVGGATESVDPTLLRIKKLSGL